MHEYGGGDYVVANDVVYFSNFVDQRLYRQEIGSEPQPVTPTAQMRYADAVIDTNRQNLICVREDHTTAGEEARNTVVRLSLETNADCGEVLTSGHDFYSTPKLSHDGRRLAWLCWNHPNMPWDGCELWLAELTDDGDISDARRVAG